MLDRLKNAAVDWKTSLVRALQRAGGDDVGSPPSEPPAVLESTSIGDGSAPMGSPSAAPSGPPAVLPGRALVVPPPPATDNPEASAINVVRDAPGGWYGRADGRLSKQVLVDVELDGGARTRILVTAVYSGSGQAYQMHFEPMERLTGKFNAMDIPLRETTDFVRPVRGS